MASTDRSIYEPSASLSFRDTLDSSVSNHRASVLASKIAPHWSPDTLPNCEVCSRPFSLSRRRHHCRKCGSLVCHKCSKNKLVVPRFGSTPERVCDSCFNTVMYNPNTALLVNFEEEDLKAKLHEATLRVAVAGRDSSKIQATIQGISVAVTGSVLGKEVDALGMDMSRLFASDEADGSVLLGSVDTLLYARNQAHRAYIEYEKVSDKPPNFSISFEPGLDTLPDGSHDYFTWVVVYNGKDFGSSRTQSLGLPPSILTHLQSSGMQKREAERIVFGTIATLPIDSSHSPSSSPVRSPMTRHPAMQHALSPASPKGAIAQLLHGKMTYSRYLEPSVVLAFLPFQWQELYSVFEL